MPEVWVIFDKKDREISEREDLYLDVRVLENPIFEEAAKSEGLKSLSSFVGYSKEVWDEMNEVTPPEFQEPWDPIMDKFYDCAEGLSWADWLESYLITNKENLDKTWDQYGLCMEELGRFRKILKLAKVKNARFRIEYGT